MAPAAERCFCGILMVEVRGLCENRPPTPACDPIQDSTAVQLRLLLLEDRRMEGPDVDHEWIIGSRWQEYDAERRANLLRVVAIAAFYLVHMANYYRWFSLPAMSGVDQRFHQLMTS